MCAVQNSPKTPFWAQLFSVSMSGLVWFSGPGMLSSLSVLYSAQQRGLTQQSGGRCSVTNSPQERTNNPIFSIDPCTKCFQGFGVGLSIQQRQGRSEFLQAEPAWPYSSVCSAGATDSGTAWGFLVSPSVLSCSTKPTFTWDFFPVFMESLAQVL